MTEIIDNKSEVELSNTAVTEGKFEVVKVGSDTDLLLKMKDSPDALDINWSGAELLESGWSELEVYPDGSVFARRIKKTFLGYMMK